MILHKWHDFVSFPLDPDQIRTAEARLRVDAVRTMSDGRIDATSPELGPAIVRWVTLTVEGGDDQFEAMEVDDYGGVTIWTTRRVWCLRRESGMERLMYLPRHPPVLTM